MFMQKTILDLVSVIIPYYKKKSFIVETVNSVLNQTYKNIEILLIYDDEDKEDLKFLHQNFQHNKNIKIYENEKNLGAGPSRNKGISLALGEYISFIDADDLWMKDKINKQIKFMKDSEFKICHTNYKVVNENGNTLGIRYARNFNYVKDILKSCDIGLSTVIIEKSIFSKDVHFANLKTKEDFVLWIKILNKGFKIGSVNEVLVKWKKTKNSLSSSVIQKLFDGFKVYNIYMKFNFIKSLYFLACLSFNYIKKK